MNDYGFFHIGDKRCAAHFSTAEMSCTSLDLGLQRKKHLDIQGALISYFITRLER